MTDGSWLDPLRAALESMVDGSIEWFFRDDDAGWADEHLWPLVKTFAIGDITLDVAAIPAALHPRTGQRLSRLVDRGVVAVHQHGWTHSNHEPTGRACEFGPGRTRAQQAADLSAGRAALEHLLGRPPSSTFVPPWNRCSGLTVDVLRELGFTALSRDRTAPPTTMPEMPVSADWTRLTRAGGLPALAADLAAQVDRVGGTAASVGDGGDESATGPIGVMLHHAQLEADDLAALGQLLDLLRRHPAVCCAPLAPPATPVGATPRSLR